MSKLDEILNKFKSRAESVDTDEKLNSLRVDFLGKSGELTEALKLIKDVPVSEKKA